MLPYEVKLTLQVLDIGSDGYHGILVWNDDDILSSGFKYNPQPPVLIPCGLSSHLGLSI